MPIWIKKAWLDLPESAKRWRSGPFFNFLAQEGYISNDVSKRLITPYSEYKLPRVLTRAEYQRLIDACANNPRGFRGLYQTVSGSKYQWRSDIYFLNGFLFLQEAIMKYEYFPRVISVLELERARLKYELDRLEDVTMTAYDIEEGHRPDPEIIKAHIDDFDITIKFLKGFSILQFRMALMSLLEDWRDRIE